jgi:hypothetical protein
MNLGPIAVGSGKSLFFLQVQSVTVLTPNISANCLGRIILIPFILPSLLAHLLSDKVMVTQNLGKLEKNKNNL